MRPPGTDRPVIGIRASLRPCGVLLAALLGAAAVAGAGCDGSDGDLSSLVVAPRVLALRADPPVTTPDGSATITALVAGGSADVLPVAPPRASEGDSDTGDGAGDDDARLDDITGTGWQLSFRACNPWRPVRDPGVDCRPDQALALPPTGMSGELVIADVFTAFPPPGWAVLDAATGSDGDGADEDDRCAYRYVEVAVVVEARQPDQGIELVAIKRLRVTLQAPASDSPGDPAGPPRTNPALATLELDGDPGMRGFRPGAEHSLLVTLDPDSLDPGCDESHAFESLRVFLYSDGGEFGDRYLDIEHTADGDPVMEPVTWLAPLTGAVRFWLVAIDGDGGVGWLRVEREPSGN